MAKLDVVASAGEGAARAHQSGAAMAEVSVTRASDGSPVTGLTDGEFDVWASYSSNAGGGFRPGFRGVHEKAANGTGPDGVYQIVFGGNLEQGGPWSIEGNVFVQVVVSTGGDVGQTVTAFYLPA